MSRHGQCRCGVRLTFRKRHGYKARCPGCGKVVRLQPDGPPTSAAASPEVLDASEAAETFEDDPLAKMVAGMEEDPETVDVVDVEPVAAELAADQPPWTWQWLAVAGGLTVWVGVLSLLSWWWWQ